MRLLLTYTDGRDSHFIEARWKPRRIARYWIDENRLALGSRFLLPTSTSRPLTKPTIKE